MYKSAPQSNYYKQISRLQRSNNCIFWIIIALSIFSFIIHSNKISLSEFYTDLTNILHILSIIAFSIISIYTDYFLSPNAQSTTRCDFFDNSFGTKYIHNQNSEDYYTNDSLDTGIYKMAVNLFESCFFTYSLSSKMILKKAIATLILFVVLFLVMFYGFKNTLSIGIVLLQTLLSAYFGGGLIKLVLFNSKNKELFNELIRLFSNMKLKQDINQHSAAIIRIYADYESNKAWSNIHINSKLYSKLNEELSKMWDNMKLKYNIS